MSSAAAKTGVDDFLAGGGTVAELLLMARPFEPVDLAHERMSRDEKLSRAVEERRRYLREMPVKTVGHNTRAAVMRELTLEAERSGKLVEGGLRVVMDRRTLAERAAKSKKAVDRAVEALEDEPGALHVDNAGRKAEKAGAFILPIAQKGTQNGKKGRREANEGQGVEGEKPLSEGVCDRGGYPSALPDEVPALRWSKTVFFWEWEGSTRKLADYFHVVRLGEKRGQIIRHVLEDGGSSTLEDLMARFAGQRTRPWDFRRRTLGPLVEAGVLEDTAEGVTLTDNWREKLDIERERAGELEDAGRQRQRHAEQRRKYRERNKTIADEEPPLEGKERVKETLERNSTIWRRQRVERERERVGTTAAVFIADTLEDISGMRWAEMRYLWRARGGGVEDLQRAVNDPTTPFSLVREADDELYVYATGARLEQEPEHEAPTTALLRPDFSKPELRDGIYYHGPECSCEWCDTPVAPKYATAWSAS